MSHPAPICFIMLHCISNVCYSVLICNVVWQDGGDLGQSESGFCEEVCHGLLFRGVTEAQVRTVRRY